MGGRREKNDLDSTIKYFIYDTLNVKRFERFKSIKPKFRIAVEQKIVHLSRSKIRKGAVIYTNGDMDFDFEDLWNGKARDGGEELGFRI